VLAIAASKLGFSPVRAYDSDRLAVEATLLNARSNGVALDAVERFDLRSGVPPAASVVAANLMRPLLLALTEAMRDGPSVVIASGLLDHEADEVALAFAPLVERRRLSLKGWAALLLVNDPNWLSPGCRIAV
jgi:ribosomal protein L11 methylase PrmA